METTNIRRKVTIAAAIAFLGFAAQFGTSATASAAETTIGVGELQECTISKSMDSTSTPLVQYATDDNAAQGASKPITYMRYHLFR